MIFWLTPQYCLQKFCERTVADGGKAMFTFLPKIGPPSQQADRSRSQQVNIASFSTTFPRQSPSLSDCLVFRPQSRLPRRLCFHFFYNHLDWLCAVNSKTTTALNPSEFRIHPKLPSIHQNNNPETKPFISFVALPESNRSNEAFL